DPINPTSQGASATGSRYTVRDGDSLRSIARNVWGDESLWYIIADANALTGAEVLTGGTTLLIPAKVTNVHNNADTFRVYDPNEAIGSNNPANPAPKPPKKNCAIIGMLLVVGVALVVSAVVGPQMGALVAKMGITGAGAGILAGAATAATASVVSQGVGVAIGVQDRINWKGVAISALSGGISGGLGDSELIRGAGKFANDVARGAVTNAGTQGIAVATGLQTGFDWAGVAAAGVVSGVGGASTRWLKGQNIYGNTNQFYSGVASGVAGAATRSLITGTSFGDNMMATLPDVLGSTLGRAISSMIVSSHSRAEAPKERKTVELASEAPADPTAATNDIVVNSDALAAAYGRTLPRFDLASSGGGTAQQVAASAGAGGAANSEESRGAPVASGVDGVDEEIVVTAQGTLRAGAQGSASGQQAGRSGVSYRHGGEIWVTDPDAPIWPIFIQNTAASPVAPGMFQLIIPDNGGPGAFAQIVFDEALAAGENVVSTASVLEQHGGLSSQAATAMLNLHVQHALSAPAPGWEIPYLFYAGPEGVELAGRYGVSFSLSHFTIGGTDAVSLDSSGLSIGTENGVFINADGISLGGNSGVNLRAGGVSMGGESGVVVGVDRISIGGYGIAAGPTGINTVTPSPSTVPSLANVSTTIS
ncbi:MAG TPA: LysM domain-containing protein, partial [Sphingomicrobium sp.]